MLRRRGTRRQWQNLRNAEPGLVKRPGPAISAPLICACYSHVKPLNPAHSTFKAAKMLWIAARPKCLHDERQRR